jgi:hypothetical protein
MCPRCEGRGKVSDIDLTQLYDDTKSLNEGALTIPGYTTDGWYGRIFSGSGFFDPDKPIAAFSKTELDDLLHKEPTKIKVEDQPHLRGPDPPHPEVIPLQGRRRHAVPHPRLRGAGDDVHRLSRLRRNPTGRTGPKLPDRRDQHRRRLRHADQRSRRLGAGLDQPSAAPLLAALGDTLDSFVEIGSAI